MLVWIPDGKAYTKVIPASTAWQRSLLRVLFRRVSTVVLPAESPARTVVGLVGVSLHCGCHALPSHPVAPVSFASLVQDWENVQEGIEATGFIGYPIRWIRGGVVSAPFRLESLSYPFLCLWQTGPMLWPVVGLPVWVAHKARCVCVGCGWKGAIACCVPDRRSCL